MKAALFRKRAPGQVVIEEIPKPVVDDHSVLVRIHTASVNALDYRSMHMGILRDGRTMGADIAGTVELMGTAVTRLKPGDAVFGDIFKYAGAFAEYAALPEEALASIPHGVTYEQAAALPVAGITALQALHCGNGISAGHQVMVLGAGGGVGLLAVQLAHHFGAQVTAVCGSANVALMENLGADCVIDYSHRDVFSGNVRYDRILAVNGNYPLRAMRCALKPGGTVVVVGGALRQIVKAMLLGPLTREKWVRLLSARPNVSDLEFLAGLVKDGSLRPVIDRRYPLDKAAEAVHYLEQGHARGKVIITVAP